jgi:hypothetical protein
MLFVNTLDALFLLPIYFGAVFAIAAMD